MPNRRRKTQESGGGSPHWMQTYSDMVTLLLAFFILLFSLSVIDVERFEEILSAIQISLGGEPAVLEGQPDPEGEAPPDPVPPDEQVDPDEMRAPDADQMEIMEQLEEAREIQDMAEDFLAEVGLEDQVDLRMDLEEGGIIMDMPDTIFFEIGEAELKPGAREVAVELAEFLEEIPNEVVVEGHTCDLPIETERFPDNWELSVARAAEVVRFLVYEEDLDPERFRATGYGEYQPREPNETEEQRAQNRRVTFVISVF